MLRRIKLILIISLVLSPLFVGDNALADTTSDLLKKQNELNQELDKYQTLTDKKSKEAQELSKQISNLQNDIGSIEKSISDTQGKIGQTEVKIGSLSEQITQKTKELNDEKAKLDNSIREIYRYSNRSDLEMIFAGGSLTDAVNQIKYTEAIQTQVRSSYEKYKTAKADLEKQKSDQEAQKAELDQLKGQQEANRKNAEYAKTQKDKLLGMTVAEKDSYQKKVADLQKEITKVSASIYAERQKKLKSGRETLGGGGSSYPYSAIDEPDAWSFLTRECTSYAAWYWNNKLGKQWYNTQPGRGSAKYWGEIAGTLGYSRSSSPSKGAFVIWTGPLFSGDQWGHVAVVETVNGDGTIDISEYNWIQYSYSYRKNVNPSDYGNHFFIN